MEESELESVSQRGEEALKKKEAMLEREIDKALEDERKKTESEFRALVQWRESEEVECGVNRYMAAGLEEEGGEGRRGGEGKRRGKEGREATERAARGPQGSLSIQNSPSTFLSSFSSWFSEPKRKTD